MNKIYKVKEAAEKLGVHYITIYNLISRGELEAVRIGRSKGLRITEEALNKFLKKNIVKT